MKLSLIYKARSNNRLVVPQSKFFENTIQKYILVFQIQE